mgnify:CR=1 FL=1
MDFVCSVEVDVFPMLEHYIIAIVLINLVIAVRIPLIVLIGRLRAVLFNATLHFLTEFLLIHRYCDGTSIRVIVINSLKAIGKCEHCLLHNCICLWFLYYIIRTDLKNVMPFWENFGVSRPF